MQTSGAETKERPELRIRSAKDVFDALRSPDMMVRFSILRGIAQNPAKAASYGTYNGSGLLDELLYHLNHNEDGIYRLALLNALAAFREPRLVEVFKNEMSGAKDTHAVMLAAAWLAGEPEERMRDFMSSILRRDGSPDRAVIAANVMTAYEGVEPRDKVRVAVVANLPYPTPPLDDETEETWLSELGGKRAERAMALLEGLGEGAFLRLRGKRAAFDEEVNGWLMDCGARKHQVYAVELLADALKSGSDGLVLRALESIPRLGQASVLFRTLLGRFLEHPEKGIRLAALRAGAPVEGIKERLAGEQDKDIRLELISRLAGEQGEAAVPVLVELLHDKAWEIRAGATNALIRIGRPAIDAVKPLIDIEDEKVRIAAAQVLIALGQDEWLEAEN